MFAFRYVFLTFIQLNKIFSNYTQVYLVFKLSDIACLAANSASTTLKVVE